MVAVYEAGDDSTGDDSTEDDNIGSGDDDSNNGGSTGGDYYPSIPSIPTIPSTPDTTTTTIPFTNGDSRIDITVKLEDSKVIIDELEIEDFDKGKEGSTIELNLTTLAKNIVTFSNKVLENVLENVLEKMTDTNSLVETFSVKFETITVEMDSQTLKAIMEQADGKEVQLRVNTMEKSDLNQKQQSALQNKNFHKAIDIYFESGNVRIGDFKGGKVDLSIPFEIPQGYDANKFSVWYVAEDGAMTGFKTTYKNNELHFSAGHFLDFVVLYNEEVKNEVEDTKKEETKEETQKPISYDTKFQTMRLKSNKSTKTTNKLVWGKVKDADGYVVYGAKCNTKDNTYKMKKQVVIKDNKRTTWTDKDLEQGTYYKYYVKAYKLVNGKKVFLGQSKTIRVTTTGGTYANPKAVEVNKSAIRLAVNETTTIKATQVKQDKKVQNYSTIKFESSNTKVATVNKDGIVTTKKNGNTTIYVYAQNGVYTKVKVTVK